MTNRQTATRLRLRTWIFFNIAAQFDSYKIQPDMMDIESYSYEIQTFKKRLVNKLDFVQ